MITISKYFPGFAMPGSDAEYCRTKCATPEEAITSECWQERVGDSKLQYADYEKVGKEMVFFDGKWGSIVAKADTVEEMQALIDLAGIKPGNWW